MKIRCVAAPLVIAWIIGVAGWIFKWAKVDDKKEQELKAYQKQIEMIYCREDVWKQS